ncbi:hypothetical protein FSP39_015245 [Pinctada imbricata]|uniref:Uncharacterized protein n=1 Tax=Pinctada imbricata TaxID=66713 RepID=A0AA88YHK2_PINIB|nr:hypothetical protein FSP39_015245 [Pinctada imbricata]
MAEMMNGFIGIAIISVWLGVTYGIPTYPTPSCSVSEEIDSVYLYSCIAILNKLTIRGGTISTIDAAAFTGLSIQPVANYPEPMGQLSFQKLTLGSALPATVFSNLGAARWIKLENIGLTSVDSSLFSSNTAIRGISLRDNAITTLPDSLFNGLDGLSELDQSNVPWDCSCGNLAFLSTLRKNNINVIGAPVCSTGENADNYYNSSCVTNSVCGDTPGLAIGGNCMFIGMLIGLIIIAIGLIFAIVALGLTCHLRKKIALQDPKRKKKAPPPPGSNPRNVANKGRRGSGWV